MRFRFALSIYLALPARAETIAIVGYSDMAAIFAKLNALFAQTHLGRSLQDLVERHGSCRSRTYVRSFGTGAHGAEFSKFELESYRW